MKRNIVTYLFSGISALFFMLAGTGFNIIHYCCNTCEDNGINYSIHHGCDEHNHHGNTPGCCKTLPNEHSLYDFKILNTDSHNDESHHTETDQCKKDDCSVQRLMLDVYAPAFPLQITDAPFHKALCILFDNRLFNAGSDVPVYSENPDPPGYIALFNQGRSVLCRKSVLLI